MEVDGHSLTHRSYKCRCFLLMCRTEGDKGLSMKFAKDKNLNGIKGNDGFGEGWESVVSL
jgi:hypothetical protein